jgi:hypothetical protein
LKGSHLLQVIAVSPGAGGSMEREKVNERTRA